MTGGSHSRGPPVSSSREGKAGCRRHARGGLRLGLDCGASWAWPAALRRCGVGRVPRERCGARGLGVLGRGERESAQKGQRAFFIYIKIDKKDRKPLLLLETKHIFLITLLYCFLTQI